MTAASVKFYNSSILSTINLKRQPLNLNVCLKICKKPSIRSHKTNFKFRIGPSNRKRPTKLQLNNLHLDSSRKSLHPYNFQLQKQYNYSRLSSKQSINKPKKEEKRSDIQLLMDWISTRSIFSQNQRKNPI